MIFLKNILEALNLRARFLVDWTSQIIAAVTTHIILYFSYFTCRYPTRSFISHLFLDMNTSVLVVLILVTHLTFITSDRSDEFQKYFKDDQNSKVRSMRVDDIPGKCESKEKCEVISGVNVCRTVSTCTK